MHEDHSPSLSIAERDGRVLVHCHAGCPQEAVISALRNRGLWPERPQREMTPAERRARAAEAAGDRADSRAAQWWAIIAEALAESILEDLPPWHDDRAPLTRVLRIARAGGAALVAEYRAWRERWPQLTAGMVRAGRLADARRQRQLAAFVLECARDAA